MRLRGSSLYRKDRRYLVVTIKERLERFPPLSCPFRSYRTLVQCSFLGIPFSVSSSYQYTLYIAIDLCIRKTNDGITLLF